MLLGFCEVFLRNTKKSFVFLLNKGDTKDCLPATRKCAKLERLVPPHGMKEEEHAWDKI